MIAPATEAPELQRPTRIRHRVVALTILLGMITYLDRVCISTLAPRIMGDLGLSKMEMSYVFTAFALSYAMFGIPAAVWADRVGTRKALTAIVVWWSAFTMATAAGINLVTMNIVRFLFGAGEAGAWPSVARTFSRWIPYRERGTVQGIFFTGAHLAGGLTPLFVIWLAAYLQWRTIFVIFGLIGFVWAAVWHLWFRDEPADHPQVNGAELQRIVANRTPSAAAGGIRLREFAGLFRNRNILALCIAYMPNSFAFYFCITWLPLFLAEKHGLQDAALGLFAGLPLVLSVLADVSGGVTTDWAVRRFGGRMGRAGVGFVSNLLAALGMILATCTAHPWLAGSLIAAATASSMFMLGAAWGTCQDVGGRHTGVVSGVMNTAGQIGSLTCPIVVTLLVRHYANWNAALLLIGTFFLVGALAWLFVDPCKPLAEGG